MIEPTTPTDIITDLDDAQRAACLSIEGPVRIIAGAGAGKTRTITRRIAYACTTGAWNPKKTLAVTFSVKAAQEMKSRLTALGVHDVMAATFHSVALQQLIHVWPMLTQAPMPRIIEHSRTIVAQAAVRVLNSADPDPLLVRSLEQEIGWMKVSMIAPEDYIRVCAATSRPTPSDLEPQVITDIMQAYEAIKTARGEMDFNDILLMAGHIGENYDEGRQAIHDYIEHVTVDEYQDVSPLQHWLMKVWLGKQEHLCVVGDPAQTIYSFAGATSYYLLNFPNEFAHTRDIELAVDYRSTPHIVQSANRVLQSSPVRDQYLHLVSGRDGGARIVTTAYETDMQEAQAIARRIMQQVQAGASPEDFAILIRINAQAAPIVRALREAGLHVRQRAEQSESEAALLDASHAATMARIEERIEQQVLQPHGDSAVRSTGIGAVTVSTIHAAKGLEWKHVYIAGVSEGLLPFGTQRSIEEIEEERRLLYVAITRGEDSVHLSFAQHKDAMSMHITRKPSRFLPHRV